jgi:cytidine deaminase
VQNSEQASRPELVFGLVGAAGARLHDLSKELKAELQEFGYTAVDIRLSDLLLSFTGWVDQKGTSEFDRIRHRQDMGNAFRTSLKDGAALARAGIAEIRARRREVSGSPDLPAPACAYVVHQLKHPDEVDLLRQVYGSSFVLVAGHAPQSLRVEELARRMAEKDLKSGEERHFKGKASDIIDADEKQEDEFGQNTRDTYPKADFFANLGVERGENKVRRFVDLLFGHPFHTPTPDEYAMYQASAAALRSSDDNRQVGAVIVSLTRDRREDITSADVIAVGMNEVPRGGGGYYWDDNSPDSRDQYLLQRDEKDDRATQIKIGALAELIERIRNKNWLCEEVASTKPNDLAGQLLPDLKRTQFMDIGEFSRPVHAEMAALIDAARRGVAVEKHWMYVTTFPCHNCAKHIIAAGLRKIVYLEPYAKSRAGHLYREQIILESAEGKEEDGKVVFAAFTGIAPRQYRQLFSMSERGAKKGMALRKWTALRGALSPPYVMRDAQLIYVAAEREELKRLNTANYRWDKKAICPLVEE